MKDGRRAGEFLKIVFVIIGAAVILGDARKRRKSTH